MRVIALVDGEHYPPVTRWGLASARAAGFEVLCALVVGGTEKLPASHRVELGDVEVRAAGGDPRRALADAVADLRPEGVLDLSDEPILGYERRMEMAAIALYRGVPYLGPDFRFDPPILDPPLPVPAVAVIGTGKRVAKTGVAGAVARAARRAGHEPVVVAMGRGGPAEPVVAGPQDVTLKALIARVERGEHAASDYLEDALTAGVPTVGARRCGGGIGGRPFVTNVAQAAARAVDLGAGLVVLEGSGASLPTVPWDAGVLVLPSSLPEAHLAGYLGPLRVLLSDLAIIIIGVGPESRPENLSALSSLVRRLKPGVRIAFAKLQPVPLGDVEGRRVFFATTAGGAVVGGIVEELERTSGCRVVRVSSNLADRAELERDLADSPPFETLVTELKAAAVDVAARRALGRGAEVVFLDNRPVAVDGGDGDVGDMLGEVVWLAARRGASRTKKS